MSLVGSPSTAIRSANSPGFTLPSAVADVEVAALPDVAHARGLGRRHARSPPSARARARCRRAGTRRRRCRSASCTPASSAALKLARLRAMPRGLRLLALLPAGVLRRRVAGRQRRAERDVAAPPSAGRPPACRRRRARSSRRRPGSPAASLRPCSRAPTTGRPLLLRRLDDRARSPRRVNVGARLAVGAPAIVGVDLDPVGAVADLIADDARSRVDRRRPPRRPAARATRARSPSGRSCRSRRSPRVTRACAGRG